MRSKRVTAFLLAVVICLSLTACKGNQNAENQSKQVSLYSVIEPDFNFNDVYMETSIHSYTNSQYGLNYYFNNKNQAYMNALSEVLKEIKTEPAADEFDKNSESVSISFYNASSESFTIHINANDQIRLDYEKTYIGEHAYEKIKETIDPFITECDKYYAVGLTPILHLYEYAIFDTDSRILESHVNSREPRIFANGNIVHMWIQSGTGTLTRSALFYDVTTGQKSPEYSGVTDYFGSLVSSTSSGKVCIYDMFSGNLLYTIDSFEYPLADAIENIFGAYFNDNGQLVVWYPDENYDEQVQTFDLPENLN
ncbi:MAG: hypothetical protein J1E05_07005 [Eubacterium sp.]|nr:hypothetical protein [Eubacterium sp.]